MNRSRPLASRIASIRLTARPLAGLLVFWAAGLVVSAAIRPGGEVTARVAGGSGPGEGLQLPGAGPGVQAVGDLHLAVEHLPWALRLLTTVPSVLALLASAAVLWIIGPAVAALRTGRPFADGSAQRLIRAAGVVALGVVAHHLAKLLVAAVVLGRTDLGAGLDRVGTTPAIQLEGLVMAYVLLLFAEAAGYGKRLSDDVEGLV